jgi:site-specific recombinase XerD
VRPGALPDLSGHGLVLPTATGRPTSERSVLRALKAAARRAGVTKEIAPRDVRRVCASLPVASDVDVARAAAILSHRRASILLGVYARALRGPKRAAARLHVHHYPPPPNLQLEPDATAPPG